MSSTRVLKTPVSNVLALVLLMDKFPQGVIAVGGGAAADPSAWFHVACTTPEGLFGYAGTQLVEFYSRCPVISPKPDQPGNVAVCRACRSAISGPRHYVPLGHQTVVTRI